MKILYTKMKAPSLISNRLISAKLVLFVITELQTKPVYQTAFPAFNQIFNASNNSLTIPDILGQKIHGNRGSNSCNIIRLECLDDRLNSLNDILLRENHLMVLSLQHLGNLSGRQNIWRSVAHSDRERLQRVFLVDAKLAGLLNNQTTDKGRVQAT